MQEVKRELAKNLRDQAKDAVKKLRENYFYETTEEVLEELELCREPVQELIRLTRQFIETFSEKKQQKNIVDFTVQTRNHYLGNDHAYILLDGGNYYIVDNNTQNHTYLNERRLEPSKPTLFHAGDTIRLADVVFNVIMGS